MTESTETRNAIATKLQGLGYPQSAAKVLATVIVSSSKMASTPSGDVFVWGEDGKLTALADFASSYVETQIEASVRPLWRPVPSGNDAIESALASLIGGTKPQQQPQQAETASAADALRSAFG